MSTKISKDIIKDFKANKDAGYAKFQMNLMPGIKEDYIYGVRTPVLRKLAKEYAKRQDVSDFLKDLPHKYFEENQLHGFIISECKDFDKCMELVNEFLPYIDNWATCDQTSPKIFKKNTDKLIPYIDTWLKSSHTYSVRFGIGMLMQHYLDDEFSSEYLDKVSQIKSEEYYINMEIAWYMATALAKQWDATVVYIENKVMNKWVHNKTIQKAIESLRITASQKEYLKTLKIK